MAIWPARSKNANGHMDRSSPSTTEGRPIEEPECALTQPGCHQRNNSTARVRATGLSARIRIGTLASYRGGAEPANRKGTLARSRAGVNPQVAKTNSSNVLSAILELSQLGAWRPGETWATPWCLRISGCQLPSSFRCCHSPAIPIRRLDPPD
jgi:hypothetical protein